MASVDAKTRMAIELVLQDLATKDLKRFDSLVGGATKRGAAGFKKLRGSINSVAGRLIALTAGAVGLAAAFRAFGRGARDFLEFGEAMAEVNTVFSGTSEEFATATERVKDSSRNLGLDEIETAAGLYQTLSAGITDSSDAYLVLAQSAELGVAGVASTAAAVDLLTGQLNAFGLEVSGSTLKRLADLNFKTVELGKTTIPALAASMGKTAPLASQLGVSIEEVNAVIATLTKGNVETSRAFTGLTAILIGLLKPVGDAEVLIEELFGTTAAAAIEADGFAAVLQKITDKFGGNTEALTTLFANVEAITPILALTGSQAEEFAFILGDMENAAGSAGEALDKQLATPGRRLKILLVGLRQGFEDLAEGMIDSLGLGSASIEEVRAAAISLREDVGNLGPVFRTVFATLTSGLVGAQRVFVSIVSLLNIMGEASDEAVKDQLDALALLVEINENLLGLSEDRSVSERIRARKQLEAWREQKPLREEAIRLAKLLGDAEDRIGENLAAGVEPVKEDFSFLRLELLAMDAIAKDLGKDMGEQFKVLRALFAEDLGTLVVTPDLDLGLDEAAAKEMSEFRMGFDEMFNEIQDSLTDRELGKSLASETFGALSFGLDQFSQDLVDGKADFGDFAESLLKDIAKIIIKILLLRSIRGFLPGLPGLADGGVLGAGGVELAAGGIMQGRRLGTMPVRSYANGGVADRPQLAVFGEGHSPEGEAFIPLGPSRKVGVQMSGGGSGMSVAFSLKVESLDPKRAADVILENMPAIQDALAGALQRGRNRTLVSQIRKTARGGR